MTVVRFDEARHLYFVDDELVPNVTRIIRALGLDGDTSFFTEESRRRGAHVHYAVHLWAQDDLEESSIYAPWKGHVEAAIRLVEDLRIPKAELQTEVRVYHPALGYTGTADVFGPASPFLSVADFVLDWKSGLIGEPTGVQTALYDMADPLPGGRRRHRFGAQIHANGKYRLVDISRDLDPLGHDYAHGAAAVALYRRFHWERERKELLRDVA